MIISGTVHVLCVIRLRRLLCLLIKTPEKKDAASLSKLTPLSSRRKLQLHAFSFQPRSDLLLLPPPSPSKLRPLPSPAKLGPPFSLCSELPPPLPFRQRAQLFFLFDSEFSSTAPFSSPAIAHNPFFLLWQSNQLVVSSLPLSTSNHQLASLLPPSLLQPANLLLTNPHSPNNSRSIFLYPFFLLL